LAFDQDAQPLLTCSPQNGILTVISAAPPPVPDGRFVIKDKVFKLSKNGSGDSLTADWSTQCLAAGYHIVEIDVQALRQSQAWNITAAHCGMTPGQSFSVLTDPSKAIVGFLVASDDATHTEGSYGQNSAGQTRPLTLVGSQFNSCGITVQDTSGVCP
jgi:hypothetical protein